MLRARPLIRQLTQCNTPFRTYTSFSAPLRKASQQQQQRVSWTRMMALASVTGMAAAGAFMTLAPSTAYSEAQAPAGANGVEDPDTHIVFPFYLTNDSEWKRLVGLGARQVSFLNINVYVLGLYMKSDDIRQLQTDAKWKQFDKADFLAKEDLALSLLNQPVDVSIRIVPARNTNTQHLRDGFTRSLLQRMRQQSQTMTEDEEKEILDAIRDFKTKFVNAKVKKDTEFVFTKTRDGTFKMEYLGKDLGTVNNKWLAVNFIMTYLNPDIPASEAALQSIATGFDALMNPPSSSSS